jgi:thiamine-phosphate pyrophosphorylase
VLIDDAYGFEEEFWARCDQLFTSEVDIIQLRAKATNDRKLVDVACQLSRQCREAGKLLVVNDRADIARVANADGLHVGQDELSAVEARSIVGPDVVIGVSTHSVEQAQQAIRAGADYIGIGPVFPSLTKQFAEYVGLELISQVNQQISLPSFAIGGIDAMRLADVVAAGATRVAVGHAIWRADDLVAAAKRMKDGLNRVV